MTSDSECPSALDSVPHSAWDRLASGRVLFGHMSVGEDILAGVGQVLSANPQVRLRIRAWDGKSGLSEPALWHARLGGNGDPLGKLRRFAEMLDALAATPPGVALMKWCYVDVGSGSDVAALQGAYRRVMGGIEERHKATRLLHVTVPLCAHPRGLQRKLRRLVGGWLGRPGAVEDNRRREEFNQWLRAQYGSAGGLVDLAEFESMAPAGACRAGRGDQAVRMLCPEHTDDGGHLNARGRLWVAERFLAALAGGKEGG